MIVFLILRFGMEAQGSADPDWSEFFQTFLSKTNNARHRKR